MIKLRRPVEVRCVDVTAMVAVEQDRPEFLAIVQLAKDFGGEISPQQVQQELFRPFSPEACRLAVDRCVKLEMLQWEGPIARLSEKGELAIATGKVLVPEQGVWRFYLVDDPLVPQSVLHAKRIETDTAHKAISNGKAQPEERSGQAPLPAHLRASVGLPPQRSLQNHKHMDILEIGAKCRMPTSGTLQLDLDWVEGADTPTIRLTGKLPDAGGSLDTTIPPAPILNQWNYNWLWIELASQSTGITMENLSRMTYGTGVQAIPVSFDSLEPESRKSFRKDFPVPPIRFPDLGAFDRTTLKQVPIVPATEQDAQAWCEWLQWTEVGGYVTPEMLRTQAKTILANFRQHRPRALEPSQMRVQAQNNRDDRSRFIFAPADLGLWSQT